jgi:hypothetical protein
MVEAKFHIHTKLQAELFFKGILILRSVVTVGVA